MTIRQFLDHHHRNRRATLRGVARLRRFERRDFSAAIDALDWAGRLPGSVDGRVEPGQDERV